MLDGTHGLIDSIERLCIRMPVTAFVLSVMLGKGRRILQKDMAEFDGSLMSIDWTPEAPVHEQRQTARMIDMAVTENNGINLTGIEGKSLPVDRFGFMVALHQAAIEKNRETSHPENMAGAGHAPGRTVEFKFHIARFLVS
jgi:hypothetical protein